jgi:hypothetical protein
MSYDIYIGNAVPRADEDRFYWDVEEVTLPDAPEWPSPDDMPDISGKTNGRHPGYGQMSDWADRVGLTDLWFAQWGEGLLSPHPGCTPLKPDHLAGVREALARFKEKHPNVQPGWGDDLAGDLARLVWYEWWMAWALNHCEHPAVYNT